MGRREASHGNRRLYCIVDPRFTKTKKTLKLLRSTAPMPYSLLPIKQSRLPSEETETARLILM